MEKRKLASIQYIHHISPTEPIYSSIIEGPLSVKVLNNDYLLKE